jgi:GTPase KRas protein
MPRGGGFLLIYSITSRESFEEVLTFYQEILQSKNGGSFPVVLIANKSDMEHERQVGTNGRPPPSPSITFFRPFRRNG